MFAVFRDHSGTLVVGIMSSLATFVLFYLMTVFALSWGTTALGYTREKFLLMQLVRHPLLRADDSHLGDPGRARPPRARSSASRSASVCSGSSWRRCSSAAPSAPMLTMALGLSLMGMTYGPLGTVLSELFPTSVRYTGSSLTFNFAGIFGASLAPYIATWLARTYGLQYVGYYLSAAAAVTLVGLLATRETRDETSV